MLLQFLRTVHISSSVCQSRELASSPLPIFFPTPESPSGTPIRGPKNPIYTPRYRPGARGAPSKEQDGGRGGRHEGFSIRAANRETSGPRTKVRASPPLLPRRPRSCHTRAPPPPNRSPPRIFGGGGRTKRQTLPWLSLGSAGRAGEQLNPPSSKGARDWRRRERQEGEAASREKPSLPTPGLAGGARARRACRPAAQPK